MCVCVCVCVRVCVREHVEDARKVGMERTTFIIYSAREQSTCTLHIVKSRVLIKDITQ